MNKSISDIIEEFIIASLDDDDFIELSRNDLAKFFSCVPSQINYVLNTRFTLNRGFVVESQRGGSGYIKVLKMQDNADNLLKNTLDLCDSPINLITGYHLLDNLKDKELLTERECEIIKTIISKKALNNPINTEDLIRANILREVIINLMKNKE